MGQGVGFYALDDIRRTKKRRAKRKTFDHDKRMYKNDGIKNEFPEISPQLRQKIKTQLSEEQKQFKRRLVIAIAASAIVVVGIMYYLLFEMNISDNFSALFSYR